MPDQHHNEPESCLRLIFLRECLDAWKFEFLFSYRLQEIGLASPDAKVKMLFRYVSGITERNLKILGRFLVIIRRKWPGSEEIYFSVVNYPDRGNIDFAFKEVFYEESAVRYLLQVMRRREATYQSLSQNATRFGFNVPAQLLTSISADYERQIQCWSSREE